MMQKLAFRMPWRRRPPAATMSPARVKAGGASAADVDGFAVLAGAGGGWNRSEYGDYYATSTSVYAAIRVRADALSRPPVVVYSRGADGQRLPVPPDHPAARLLERVNRWYTRSDLWRATEIYLNLWGSAFWDAGPRRPRQPRALAAAPRPHVRGARPGRSTFAGSCTTGATACWR